MTRRELLLALAANAIAQAKATTPMLSMQGYIFQQYAERVTKALPDVIDEVLPMARAAGFRNIELTDAFFVPEVRGRVSTLLRSQGLAMPSVYVGGAMHSADSAELTSAKVLETLEVCAPLGCKAVVNNPDPKAGGAPKDDAELATQADALNRLGRELQSRGGQLRVHHHTPQLENHAREWRFILRNTDPEYVHLCVDVDWAYEGGFDPINFLIEAGKRVAELHVRSARDKVWLEDVEDSDIDYRAVAALLKRERMDPLIVVELAYRPQTRITRGLELDLQLSRKYVEKVFGL